MRAKPLVFCPDVLRTDVRELMLSEKPRELDLVFVESGVGDDRLARAREADYLLVGPTPITAALIDALTRARLIVKLGVGLENVDLGALAQRGIPICIQAGGNSVAVAELAITLILALYRKLPVAHNSLREGRWIRPELRAVSRDLSGKTVGIVGAGHSGQALGRMLGDGFGCSVHYHQRHRLADNDERTLGMSYLPLEEMLRVSDIVSLHVPLTGETRGMIGERELGCMKRSAILINVCRGAVVNEAALIAALREGIIAGAGLDVFTREPPDPNNPLLRMDNVVVTPHIAGATEDTFRGMTRHAFANIMRAERGEPLPEEDRVPLERMSCSQ